MCSVRAARVAEHTGGDDEKNGRFVPLADGVTVVAELFGEHGVVHHPAEPLVGRRGAPGDRVGPVRDQGQD